MQADGSEYKHSDGNGEAETTRQLMGYNQLSYKLTPDVCAFTDRSMKRHPAQQRSYNLKSGETITFVVNSGAEFIGGQNSYLCMDLNAAWTDLSNMSGNSNIQDITHQHFNPQFNYLGSVLDLIQRIVITDRAGTEIVRTDDVGRLANCLVRACYSPAWFKSNGKALGFRPYHGPQKDRVTRDNSYFPFIVATNENRSFMGISSTATQNIPAQGKTFVIPLRWICGLFDFDQLLPPQLMSGLRIQITLQRTHRALQFPIPGRFNTSGQNEHTNLGLVPTLLNITVDNPVLVLDSYRLTDSLMRTVNEMASNDGLDIEFRTWFNTEHSQGTASEDSIEIRKAMSRAFGALAFSRPTLSESDEFTHDSNETVPYDYLQWQFRAGNQYYPFQKLEYGQAQQYGTPLSAWRIINGLAQTTIQGPPTSRGGAETYFLMQRMFGKHVSKDKENDMHEEMYGPREPGTRATSGDVEFDQFHYASMRTQTSPTRLTTITHSPDPGGSGTVYATPAGWAVGSHLSTPVSNYAVIPVDLERSAVLDMSGTPLNNARILEFNVRIQQLKEDTALVAIPARTVSIHTSHLRIVRVFLDNSEVEE